MKDDVSPRRRPHSQRTNDPDGNRRNIIEVATQEFAEKGCCKNHSCGCKIPQAPKRSPFYVHNILNDWGSALESILYE